MKALITPSIMYLAIVLALVSVSDIAGGQRRIPEHLLCGSRCAQFILAYYDRIVSLEKLETDSVWTEIRDGMPLTELQAILKKWDLHSYPMSLDRPARIVPTEPCVLHLEKETDRIGHYVVVLPDSSVYRAHLWDPAHGFRYQPWTELNREMTGTVLVVSTEPLVEPAATLGLDRWRFEKLCIGSTVLLFATVLTVGAWRFLPRSLKNR